MLLHDVRRLAHLLVGSDDEALDDARVDAAADGHDDVERDGPDDGQEPRGKGLVDGEAGADERRGGQQAIRRHARVDVHVRGAEDHAGLLGQQMRDPEPRAERQDHEERGGEQRQMPPGGAAGDHAAQRIEREVARGDVRPGDAGDRQDDGRERDPVHELEHRQPEQVERDVAAEHRVGAAERRGVNAHRATWPRTRPSRGR